MLGRVHLFFGLAPDALKAVAVILSVRSKL
jgi:hypothetical protein